MTNCPRRASIHGAAASASRSSIAGGGRHESLHHASARPDHGGPFFVKELAKAKYRTTRTGIARVLAEFPADAKEAVPHLLPMLKDVTDFTRLAAVKALDAMGPAAAAAVPSLLPLLQDDSDDVCEAAAAALKKIDPKARMPK